MKVGDRIYVIGSTASGKTTLARSLSNKLGVPHTELDALWWLANWTNPARNVFQERVLGVVNQPNWVVDGNYGRVRDIIWKRADTIIWLDLPMYLILFRLLHRTIRRIVTKEELWNGNQERIKTHFCSKESLFLWVLQSHWRRKRKYLQLFDSPRYAHLERIRLSTSSDVQQLLGSIVEKQKF